MVITQQARIACGSKVLSILPKANIECSIKQWVLLFENVYVLCIHPIDRYVALLEHWLA